MEYYSAIKGTNSWCLPQHGEAQTLSEKSQAKVHPARDPIYRKHPKEANLSSQEVYLWLPGAAAGNQESRVFLGDENVLKVDYHDGRITL